MGLTQQIWMSLWYCSNNSAQPLLATALYIKLLASLTIQYQQPFFQVRKQVLQSIFWTECWNKKVEYTSLQFNRFIRVLVTLLLPHNYLSAYGIVEFTLNHRDKNVAIFENLLDNRLINKVARRIKWIIPCEPPRRLW